MLKVEKDADFASNIFLFSFFYGLVHLGILNFREAEIPSFPFFTFFFQFHKEYIHQEKCPIFTYKV